MNASDAADKVNNKGDGRDIDTLFLNALGMRWLVIDEISTLSPYLQGLLDAYLRRACCRHPYAVQDADDLLEVSTWFSRETSGN